MTNTKSRKTGGFASLSPERRREIASKGGLAAQKSGNGHKFTKEEAKAAGSKGGNIIASRPGYMSELGRLGGIAKQKNKEGTI